jgi:hypothetical protein
MDRGACELVGGDGRLVYNTGNLCIHYYSTAFLEGPCSPEHLPKVYHLAKKVGGVVCDTRSCTLLIILTPLTTPPQSPRTPYPPAPSAPRAPPRRDCGRGRVHAPARATGL